MRTYVKFYKSHNFRYLSSVITQKRLLEKPLPLACA
jgi:hypothetical protein